MGDDLLAEQIRYYRQRAAEYDSTSYSVDDRRMMAQVVSRWPARVPTLELACGTGRWTAHLAVRTDDLLGVDASMEMLSRARTRCPPHVRFVCADVMQWLPGRRFDLVVFVAWLSHIPVAAQQRFFDRLRDVLSAEGCVAFVDEHVSRAVHEHWSDQPGVASRILRDGSVHRVVKVFIDPEPFAENLSRWGWHAELQTLDNGWVAGLASPSDR